LESWRHPFAGAWFEGDGYLAMLGAFEGGEGGVVIAGTGSIGVTYKERLVRVGGYGFPVSDEGSGADLGLNALRHALRTLDGRAAPSAFSRAMLARFGNDAAEVTAWMDEASATDYATLAPIVVEHASAGDAVARRLMQDAAARIAEIVEALFAKGAPQIALIGGVAEPLKPYMPPALVARLAEPKADAMAGGILIAKRRSAALHHSATS
jgi:glucosamine kinase